MSLVFIVGSTPDGRRCWCVGTNTKINRFQQPVQYPLFDDESSKQFSLEFALDARERWKNDFGINVQITLEKYGQPIDEDRASAAPEQDRRQSEFVPFSNGLGLKVVPGITPKQGQVWFVRAADIPAFSQDGRHTVIESVSGATPTEAAQRAVDSWGQEILFRDPAQDERDEKARQQARAEQQRNQTPRNIRPGDRR
jgi:hypothetical protein